MTSLARIRLPQALLWMFCLAPSFTMVGVAQESQIIQLDRERIHIRTWGNGPPILVINGGPGFSSEGFEQFAESLSRFGHIILYDQRGTGRSTLPLVDRRTVTLAKMVDDIETIRTHLGYETWVVLGHSFGGMLASAYTARHPERVSGLILSSSGGVDAESLGRLNVSGRLSRSHRDSLRVWTMRISAGDTTRRARYLRNMYLAHAYVIDTTHVPVVANRLMQLDRRVNRLVVRDMRRTGFDVAADLVAFAGPVLIIHGDHDIVPVDVSEKANDIFQNSKLIVVEESGHFVWLEQPKTYFGSIGRFIDSEL